MAQNSIKNNAVIFHPYFSDDYLPMLEAITPRHKAYCEKWGFDFVAFDLRTELADVTPETAPALPVNFIKKLLKKYEFVVKLDVDTLIWDMDIDLRAATDIIGAVRFSKDRIPAKIDDFLNKNGAGKSHLNDGAVYIKSNPFTKKFVNEWLTLTKELPGWYANQNAFNILAIKYDLPELDAKWNYTRIRHGRCDNPVVIGYHGYKGFDSKMDEVDKDIKKLNTNVAPLSLSNRINQKMIGRLASEPEELELLAKYAGMEGDHLEIGCLWGGTAILAALSKVENKVKGHIYTVDSMRDGWWKSVDPAVKITPTLEKVEQNLKLFGVADRVSVIVGKSDPLPLPDGVKPTTVFIDADHTEEGCTIDWNNVKRLKPDYVLFHDYIRLFGVKQAVDKIRALESEWEVVDQAKTMIVFKRVEHDPSRPTVSVIVPTRNRPELLKRALQSIKEQAFQNYEIIVINDAGEPVDEVVAQFDKIRLVTHEKNKGLAATRNAGIKASKGRYITFLDDDDVILPNHFELLVEALDKGASFAYTNYYIWKNEEELIEAPSLDYDPEVLARRNLMAVHCVMIRRELFNLEMFDESLPSHEDYDLWLRMSRHINFVHVPHYTVYYSKRKNSDQISGQFYHAKYLQIVQDKNRKVIREAPRAKEAPHTDGYRPVKVKRYFVTQVNELTVKCRAGETVRLPVENLDNLRRGGYIE